MWNGYQNAAVKSLRALWQAVPLILGILMLVSLAQSLLGKGFYLKMFGYGPLGNSVIGSAVGSISGGSPVNSYIIGGEILKQGVGIAPVTAFIFAWVTVGFLQVPIEARFMGLKFAIWRNVSAFLLAIAAGWLTGAIL